MASTKYKLAEELINIVSGGAQNRDNKITINQAALFVSQAANKYIRDFIYQSKAMGVQDVPYDVLKSFTVTTKKDVKRNAWYVTLPNRGLSTLIDGLGIYQVRFEDEIDNVFIPTSVGFDSIFSRLDAYTLEKNPSYYPERDRIYFRGVSDVCDISVVMIVDNTTIGNREPLTIPADAEYEVLQMALQLAGLQQQSRADNINNDSPS